MTHPFTIGQMLTAQARLQPDRIGARDLERAMTFAEWNARANRLANALMALGISKGERVAILAYNRVEWAEIYVACAKAGIVAVPINFRLTGQECLKIIENSGAVAVITEDKLRPTIESIRAELMIRADRFVMIGQAPPDDYVAYESLLAGSSDQEPDVAVGPDDHWALMYTSGTTGDPKGAIRDHRGVAMLAFMTQVELSLHQRDEALLVMPMCHANSLYFFASFAYCGAAISIYSRPQFDPVLCLEILGTTGATFTSLVPTQYGMMLDVPEEKRAALDFGRVEKLMISSAPAHPATKRAIMEMFPNSGLFELYGSTEGGWVTMLHPDEQFDRLGTVGRETVGSLPVRFLDDHGHDVPDGDPGELFSCNPYSFKGYWNQPDKDAEAFRGDYLSVGDIGFRDADGFIHLIDRKKNMIITGGENVYPSEVEQVLAAHPAVRDVAVVGRPDAKWGESVQAAIVLKPGTEVSADELIDFCRDRLAGFKRPRGIHFLEPQEMPRNATGKILHRQLRELIT